MEDIYNKIKYETFNSKELSALNIEKTPELHCTHSHCNAKKYGEILLCMFSQENLIFLCTFCDAKVLNITEFVTHIKYNHLEVVEDKNYNHPTEPEFLKLEGNEYKDLSEKYEENFSSKLLDEDICVLYREQSVENTSMENLDITEPQMIDENSVDTEPDEQLIKVKETEPGKKRSSKVSKSSYSCKICNKQFQSEKCLENHSICNHNTPNPFLISASQSNPLIDDEGESDGEEKLKIFAEPIEIDPLLCQFCSRRFKQPFERVEHERLHTGEKPFPCEFCDKRFRLKTFYKAHIMVHKGIKPYKCNMCDAAFTNQQNYICHIRVHTGERRFKCGYCEKRFIRNVDKTLHERTHTGEKPHQCIECGKCFPTTSRLTEHSKRHSGLKPHKCKECDKCFVSKKALRNHAVVHSNERRYVCVICNASFHTSSGLRSHEKLHSSEVGYVCKVCGKGFKQNAGLYSHMKSHGEKLNK